MFIGEVVWVGHRGPTAADNCAVEMCPQSDWATGREYHITTSFQPLQLSVLLSTADKKPSCR